MISQSERDRVEYEAREKRRRDLINRDELIREGGWEDGRDEGREEGRVEGREEGREEGIRKGILIGGLQRMQRILAEAVTPTSVLAQMSLERLSELVAEYEQRLDDRGNN